MRYTEEKRKQIYLDAIKYWGEMAQFDQFIEESCELIVAINKYKRQKYYGEYENKPEIVDNLIEELADTMMCVELLCDMMGKDKVYNKLDEKFDKFSLQIEKAKEREKNKKV